MNATVEKYQGWTNHATWCANLHFTNNERWANHRAALVASARDDAEIAEQVKSGIWTVEEARRFLLADALKDWAESIVLPGIDDAAEEVEQDRTAFQIDLMRGYLEDVNWRELADSALSDFAADMRTGD